MAIPILLLGYCVLSLVDGATAFTIVLTIIALFIVRGAWKSYTQFRDAVNSLSLGSSVMLAFPTVGLAQAALLVPWALWIRFVLAKVLDTRTDTRAIFESVIWQWHDLRGFGVEDFIFCSLSVPSL